MAMKMPKQRLAELQANPKDRRHGTKTGANLGCRCPECQKARYEISEERRQRNSARRDSARIIEEQYEAARKRRAATERSKDVCTIDALLLPLMGKPSIDNAFGACSWCGAHGATNRHHIVKRSAGKWVKGGREVKKPTILLCGDGNASGCHAKAHAGLLHFRWVDQENVRVSDPRDFAPIGSGHWEGLETEEPMKYQEALGIKRGWRKLIGHESGESSASQFTEKD